MSLSSFSLILGITFYLVGFPMVFGDEAHLRWRKRLLDDQNMVRVLGALFLMIAVVTLRYQWKITPDGEGLIIAIAWITAIKALCKAWFPAKDIRWRGWLENTVFVSSQAEMFLGFVIVLLGALFTYFGFILI